MSEVHVYTSTEYTEIEDFDDIQHFSQLLYKFNEATLLMSQATSMDDLYRITIESAVDLLEIDRIGILLLDKKQQSISGTWGTDEQGNIRSESDFTSPLHKEFSEIIHLINNKGKVCIWENQSLYEFSENKNSKAAAGVSWNSAVALWQGDHLIGWIACDNLIKQRPFKAYISHILRLLGSVLSEYRLRFLALEKISKLNEILEKEVLERTSQLVQTQNALETANQELELKIKQRTKSLKEKNNQLELTIKRLKSTETQLNTVQTHGAMKDLVVGGAHEINTPLGIAITASSNCPHLFDKMHKIITSKQTDQLPQLLEQAKQTHDILLNSLQNTATLITEFKRLSTIEVESIPAKEVVLKKWLDKMVLMATLQEKQIKDLNIQIKVNLPPAEPEAYLITPSKG